MRVDSKKLKLAMARSCMNTSDLVSASQISRPTIDNVIGEKGISPRTLGCVARALNCDPTEILMEED